MKDNSIKIGNNNCDVSQLNTGENVTQISNTNEEGNVNGLKETILSTLKQIESSNELTNEQKSKLIKTLKTTKKNVDNNDVDNLETNIDLLQVINKKLSAATKTAGLITLIITKIKEIYPF